MYGCYLLDYSAFTLRILSEDLVVYVPKHYVLLSSHQDFAKAFRAANATPALAEKTVVVYFEEFERLPKKLSLGTATRRAKKVAETLGKEV